MPQEVYRKTKQKNNEWSSLRAKYKAVHNSKNSEKEIKGFLKYNKWYTKQYKQFQDLPEWPNLTKNHRKY